MWFLFLHLKQNGKRIIVMDATENKIRGCGKSLTDTLYMGNFGYRIKVHDLLWDITENNAEHHLRVCSKNKNNHIKSLFLVTDSIPLGVIVHSYGVKLLFIDISLYSSISKRILCCRLYFSRRMIFSQTFL